MPTLKLVIYPIVYLDGKRYPNGYLPFSLVQLPVVVTFAMEIASMTAFTMLTVLVGASAEMAG